MPKRTCECETRTRRSDDERVSPARGVAHAGRHRRRRAPAVLQSERAGVHRVPLAAPDLRAVVDRQPHARLAPGHRMPLLLSYASSLRLRLTHRRSILCSLRLTPARRPPPDPSLALYGFLSFQISHINESFHQLTFIRVHMLYSLFRFCTFESLIHFFVPNI